MAPLLSISLLARAAITADVMALTMYVVLGLDMSYAAAGGVAAAMTAGMALGGPLLGRMIDWRGPRTFCWSLSYCRSCSGRACRYCRTGSCWAPPSRRAC